MKTKTNTQVSSINRLYRLIIAFLFVSTLITLTVIIVPKHKHIGEFLANFTYQHYFIAIFILLSVFTLVVKFINEYFKTNSLSVAGINTYDYYKLPVIKGRWNRRLNTFRKKLRVTTVSNKNDEPVNDVLSNEDEKQKRYRDLLNAMTLGNNFKHKVKIYYVLKNNTSVIETTVWYANASHVTLKGGTVLPVKSIIKVEY